MQSPICASLTMSESTLLVVCYCLYTCVLFILFVSPLQSSQIDQLIYISMLYISSMRCLTETLFKVQISLVQLFCWSCRKLNLIKGPNVTSRDITFNFSFTWKRDFMHAYPFLNSLEPCVVAYHCNTFHWHVLHWTKYSKNFILFYLYFFVFHNLSNSSLICSTYPVRGVTVERRIRRMVCQNIGKL